MSRITAMTSATTVLLIGLLIGLPLPRSVQASGSENGIVETPFEGSYTDAEKTLIDWATQRFVSAGLTPPAVVFVFHASTIDCYGHVGLYYTKSNTLHMCRLDKPTILHELAHAWLHENLTATTIVAFVTSRDLATWNGSDEPWKLRATEHAAEIISWALLDRNRLVRWVGEDGHESYRLLTIPNSSPAKLAEGFELLTGAVPAERLLDDPRRAAFLAVDSPESRRGSQRGDTRLDTADWKFRMQSDS
jgi:hypothetical protein